MKLNKIIDIVNEEFGVDIRETKRNLQNMYALKTYVHLARENTCNGLVEIGERVNRSHSNIFHHLNGKGNIIELIKFNKDLAGTYTTDDEIEIEKRIHLREMQATKAEILAKKMIKGIEHLIEDKN